MQSPPTQFSPTLRLGGAASLTPAVLAASVLALGVSQLPAQDWTSRTLLLVALLISTGAALTVGLVALRRLRRRTARRTLTRMMAQGLVDGWLTDATGMIVAPSGRGHLGDAIAPRVADSRAWCLELQAAPRPLAPLERDVQAAAGPGRVSVHRIGGDTFLWRHHVNPAAAPAQPDPVEWDAVEALPLPLIKTSTTGEILAINRQARAILPGAFEEGARLSDLLEGLGRPVAEWVADVAAGRPMVGPQFLRGTGDQQDTVLRVALSPAGLADDPYLLAVLDDVTELKALEAQFVQSQKMQALGQLAGGVAHDFNNLLTAISGHGDLLLHSRTPEDPDYADLIQIRQNVNRAAGLVSQLLAFSRKQSMVPETVDLRAALSDLTHLLDRLVGERVQLSLRHDPDLLYIRADRRQFEQVIVNLVVNARDAMPDGGVVRIGTALRTLDDPQTLGRATVPPGRYVVIEVSDAGTGIPEDRLPRIFEPFYTTKKLGEGTGLGLSTAYGIVKQSGGYIFAESEVGAGSTFTLWFPAHDRPRAPRPAPATPAAVRRPAQGRVLLVEDEAPVRSFAARSLRLRGHSVHEAACAEDALALLADAALGIDLVVTDVILPDMDGPTWVRRALESRPGLRVVFTSGYAEESFAEHKEAVAGSTFLPKPFSLAELTAEVERVLSDPAP